MNSTHALKVAAPVVLGVIVVEAGVSIVERWPHAFGGAGDPDHIVAEFVSTGTALAPPLVLIVVLALIAFALQLPGRWRSWASVLMVPLSLVLAVGALGELLAVPVASVPPGVHWVGGVLGVALSLLLFVLSVGSLVDRRRAARRSTRRSATVTSRPG